MRTKVSLLAAILALAAATNVSALEPKLVPLVLASDAGHGSHSADKAAAHHLGDLEMHAPFARATLPNQPVAGAFLTIKNAGADDDVLVAASTTMSGRTEIHEMAMSGDTMKMRALPDGLVIPAGATVELAPGGYHVMLMDLNGPLIEGESFEIILEFEHAGKVTVPFSIVGKSARKLDHSGHGS